MTEVTLVVVDDAISPAPLADVLVRIYSEDGDTFITELTTDVDGRVTTDLPEDEVYWVRFFKVGYAFDSRCTINVDSALLNSFDAVGHDLTTYPGSTDPNLCRVTGYLLNAAGTPSGNVTLYFMLTGRPRVVGGRAMLPSKVYTTTNSEGYIDIHLVRNGVYEAWASGTDDTTYRIVIPDYGSADISELLFPELAALELSEDTVNLSVDGTADVEITATLTTRVTLPYTLDNGDSEVLGTYVQTSIADTSVASYLIQDNMLTIRGIAPGSTTLTVAEKPDVFALRQPVDPLLSVSCTITVT
jgi:hypothetical protein